MHFWLAAERQIAIARGHSRNDPVEGYDDLAITRRLFETIWHVDQNLKPQLTELVERYAADREYHHVTTLEQLEALAESAWPGPNRLRPRGQSASWSRHVTDRGP